MAICAAVFAVQAVAERLEFLDGYTFGKLLSYVFGLHWPLLSSGFFWQPVTYIFLHGTWMHLLANLVPLLFFGSDIEAEVGRRRFWVLFLVTGAVAGIGWMIADWSEPAVLAWLRGLHVPTLDVVAGYLATHQSAGRFGICIGASGGVFGLMGAYVALFHRRHMGPVLWLLALLSLGEPAVLRGQVAYVAHLVGLLAGYLVGRSWQSR